MFKKIFIFYLLFSFQAFAQEERELDNLNSSIEKVDAQRFMNKAIIQILNKTTAKNSIVDIHVGNSYEEGNLSINILKCWQAPPENKPDSKILMEIYETKSGVKTKIFHGWMIASSPSISTLEHPIYDIVAISCK